ncbi:MmcQ/YjbR family DNA-binding protein [Venatoribacter cucullus]|uniref:MmcQ/YjbR family DNA-binding protein n=1 Tax=Venatoribacter cucullus TaxID=2661630 RepID=A0A9X7YPT0_9GAMM|nr:MmcQ/YjbR family DNA-binding protein [Venatoribacter cucullus]QQD25081.1 MmcQ/YjbR family DNA-binding protein [Venatoribacter cucullus]
MDFAALRAYLLSKPEAQEDFPFGPDAYVYKLQGKMFALLYEKDGQARVNLKCEPLQAQQLRDVFQSVIPGWHMNKTHWNTVLLGGDVPPAELQRLIDHSYARVLHSLTAAQRRFLTTRYSHAELGLDQR